MIVGLLFAGVMAGICGLALALAAGQPVWFALMAYAGAGSSTVMALAVLLVVAQGVGRSRRTAMVLSTRRG
jgi:hypothetical protein